jgi:hypothetical protein
MRIVASEFISLDGVVQAPGGSEEDTSGGFAHGGWSQQFFDPKVMGPVIDEFAERSDALPYLSGLGGSVAQPRRKSLRRLDQPRAEICCLEYTLGCGSHLAADHDHPRRRPRRKDLHAAEPARWRHLPLRQPFVAAGTADGRAGRRARAHDRANHPRRRQDPVPHRWQGADLRAHLGPDRSHRRSGLPLPARSLTPAAV